MGMSYKYAGSASYPRFDRELQEIAELFGGKSTKYLTEHKETENERLFGYWFGYYSSLDSKIPRFSFPESTNPLLVVWFNDIYSDYHFFDTEETKVIYEELKKHWNDVCNISPQIANEIETCVDFDECWDIIQ